MRRFSMTRALSPSAWCGVALSLLSVGCGIETEPSSDAEISTTHAVVTIERSESADGQSSKAAALAGFLNVPALVDAHSVLSLVGLGLDLPEPGTCSLGGDTPTSAPLTETALVEFIDAGDVELEVAGARERLAPYAFPTVTDSISGVLYTSRGRASDPLPSGARYTLSAGGLGLLASHDAPKTLSGVTANGIPLAEVVNVNTTSPLDVTWDVGAAGDIVYVELTSSASPQRTLCSFQDDLGAGSVPTEAFAREEAGQVSVHRIRSHAFDVPVGESSRGQLRFDFALTAGVTFD